MTETVLFKVVKVYYCRACWKNHREDMCPKNVDGVSLCPTKRRKLSENRVVGTVTVAVSP